MKRFWPKIGSVVLDKNRNGLERPGPDGTRVRYQIGLGEDDWIEVRFDPEQGGLEVRGGSQLYIQTHSANNLTLRTEGAFLKRARRR